MACKAPLSLILNPHNSNFESRDKRVTSWYCLALGVTVSTLSSYAYGTVLSAIVDYSSTGATHLGLWAHLQQPLATTAGINNSYTTVPTLRTVRAREGH